MVVTFTSSIVPPGANGVFGGGQNEMISARPAPSTFPVAIATCAMPSMNTMSPASGLRPSGAP